MDILQIVKRIARGVLRRRKRLALISAVIAMVALVPLSFYLSKEPPRFRTSAVILLEARPDRSPIFQEFSPFRPLPVQLAILRSRSLAETVIETLPKSSLQDLVENPYYVDWIQQARNAYLQYMGREPEVESPQRRALRELQEARVGFELKSDGIVMVSAEASRPQVAVDIANTYIEALMSRTRSFNIDDARVTREFLETQLADVKKNLTNSEQTLRSFVSAHGGVKIPERSQATVAQLSQAETALAEIQTSAKMLETRLEGLRQKAEHQKRTAVSQPAQPGAASAAPPRQIPAEVQRLRTQLAQLEGTLLDLRTRFTDEHPRIRLVRDRISEIQTQLGDAIKDTGPIVAAVGAVPPAERVNFAEQLVMLEASYHSVKAQEEAIRKQVESLRQNLRGLSNGELEYARLNRDADSNRSLHSMLADKLTAARIREQGEMKVVKVIDPPGFPSPAMSQRRVRFLLGGFMLSLVVGLGVPAAVEWLQKRVETEDDVELATGLPVLAIIPRLRSQRPIFVPNYENTGKHPGEQMIFTEAFRTLRVSVQFAMKMDGVRSIMVSSGFAHEGKSTVVTNLGCALAEVGTRVMLADADLQRPMLHRTMKVKQSGGGLVKALHSQHSVDDAMMPVGDNMWLVPRGDTIYPHTRGFLATTRFREVVTEMSGKADVVICDSSPLLLIPDNVFVAGAVDAVILVVKAGSTGCRDLAKAKAILDSAGAKVLGVVINEMPVASLRNHYRKYYYSYVKKG